MLKVVKFGGGSLADAEGFKKVKNIILSDSARKAAVVSAPGKRYPGDNKLTDLLYLCYAHIKYGVDCSELLSLVKKRYEDIVNGLSVDFDLDVEFEEIRKNLKEGASEDYLVSRGEYLSAKLVAVYLGWEFADAYDHIFFNYEGGIDEEKTYEALSNTFAKIGPERGMVLPGFFGQLPGGELSLMSRGGSDITGALLAAALKGDVYENWTDVPGILMADPRIVEQPYPIPRITYDELRELTHMGAKVLHEASVQPVRKAGIPVVIKDTKAPAAPGTLIKESFAEDERVSDRFYITGIAGKKGFSIIELHYPDIAHNVDMFSAALKVLSRHSLPVEQISSYVDGVTFLVPTELMKPRLFIITKEMEDLSDSLCVTVTNHISLIACVSRLMVYRSGISGKLFEALGEHGINIRTISQGASELNITIGVDDKDFESAVRVLYDRFTKRS